jgi:hypothetical protein
MMEPEDAYDADFSRVRCPRCLSSRLLVTELVRDLELTMTWAADGTVTEELTDDLRPTVTRYLWLALHCPACEAPVPASAIPGLYASTEDDYQDALLLGRPLRPMLEADGHRCPECAEEPFPKLCYYVVDRLHTLQLAGDAQGTLETVPTVLAETATTFRCECGLKPA